jgi:hypothetical protein
MRDWHGMEKKAEMTFFYTIKKPKKENSFCRVVTLGKTHLKVHGYMHSCIVNQLIELEIVPSLGSFALEQSRSKQKWKSIIKQGNCSCCSLFIPLNNKLFSNFCLFLSLNLCYLAFYRDFL